MRLSNDLPVDDQHRANGNATFGQPFAGLLDGGLQERSCCLLGHVTVHPSVLAQLVRSYRHASEIFWGCC